MKRTLSLFLILLSLSYSYSQTINDLNSFKNVANFLNKEINKKYTFESVFDNEEEADKEDFNYNVKKIDVDNNGLTDLVVDAYGPSLIVLNNGQNQYKELSYEENLFSGKVPELDSIIKIRHETIFIFKTEISEYDDKIYPNTIVQKDKKVPSYNTETKELKWVIKDVKFIVDSLTVKFGELVTYVNNKPIQKNKIKKLHFSTTACFGSCPIFEINLNSKGKLKYKGKGFTNHTGVKTIKLNSVDLENLFDLLEYSNLKSLENSYSINSSDHQTGKLKVTYENGDHKEITDYGLQGTIDLQAIYNKLFEISDRIK